MTYALEGSVFVAGAAVQWLRDGLGLIRASADVEALAARSTTPAASTSCPPSSGSGRRTGIPTRAGAIVGLTRGTAAPRSPGRRSRRSPTRSADVVEAMDARSRAIAARGPPGRRRSGGQRPRSCSSRRTCSASRSSGPTVVETTASGRRALAGLAIGFWGSPAEIAAIWRGRPAVRADDGAGAADRARCAGWHRAVERSRDWARPTDGARTASGVARLGRAQASPVGFSRGARAPYGISLCTRLDVGCIAPARTTSWERP